MHYFVTLLHNKQAGDTNYQDVRRGFLSNRENMAVCKLFDDFTEMFFHVGLLQANDALLTHKAGPERKWPNQVMCVHAWVIYVYI